MRSDKTLQSNLAEIAILVTKYMVFRPAGQTVWRKHTRKGRASFLLKGGSVSYAFGRRCASGDEALEQRCRRACGGQSKTMVAK